MKVKLKTPHNYIIALSRREIMVINNCLNEACHGLIMDRFIPAHDELMMMHDQTVAISRAHGPLNLKPVAV